MSDFMWWILIIGGFVLVFSLAIKSGKEKEEAATTLADRRRAFLNGMNAESFIYKALGDTSGLAQAKDGRTWAFRPGENQGQELNYTTLLGAEVLTNGSTVTKAHRGRQIGAALVGGMVAGRVGALIGGLGAKQTTRTTISNVTLRLTVADPQRPFFDFPFFIAPIAIAIPDQVGCNAGLQAATEWCARMEIAMRQDPGNELPAEPTVAAVTASDRAEELKKWISMKEAGHISEEEFTAQKRRILED